MPIKVAPGPGGKAAQFITISGVSSEQSTAMDFFNYYAGIYAQVSAGLPDHAEIINVPSTEANGFDVRRIGPLHYSDWRDQYDASFNSSFEVVDYISSLINTLDDENERLYEVTTRDAIELTFGAGNPIFYKHNHPSGISYFWEESTIPSTLDISHYDNRIVTGVISTPGVYVLEVEVSNITGITTDSIEITIV